MDEVERLFRKKVLFVTGVVFLCVALATSIVLVPDVLLLIFAGILVAVFLRSLTDALEATTGIPSGWSLGIVVLSLGSLFAAMIYLMAPSITDQFDALMEEMPASVERLRTQIERYSWGRILLDKAGPENISRRSHSLMTGVGGAFSSILGWAANLVVIFFVGLYGAIEPGIYKRGFLYLIRPERRAQIAQLISEINETLKWWLIGKFFGMAVIGIFTTAGLWLLDVPLAFILGLIAALFTFIPNLGPIFAAFPAVLLGMMVSPVQALYIGLLYLGIQIVESYFLTPLVQRRTIELPPALTLASQVFLGVSVGGLGVALASPLTAVGIVAIKRLYVKMPPAEMNDE